MKLTNERRIGIRGAIADANDNGRNGSFAVNKDYFKTRRNVDSAAL